MNIHILSLFPEVFPGIFNSSIIGRAQGKGLVKINYHQLRKWAIDKRGTVDGRPYGGGVGMILRVEPVFKALLELKKQIKDPVTTVLLTTKGTIFTQAQVRKLADLENIILICPHYEGYDERIVNLVDVQISIGNYILTGGEIPAMVLVDSIVRLLPGTLSKPEATQQESFREGQELEHPQYTRPEEFNSWKVPEILLSGNHEQIKAWKKAKEKAV